MSDVALQSSAGIHGDSHSHFLSWGSTVTPGHLGHAGSPQMQRCAEALANEWFVSPSVSPHSLGTAAPCPGEPRLFSQAPVLSFPSVSVPLQDPQSHSITASLLPAPAKALQRL